MALTFWNEVVHVKGGGTYTMMDMCLRFHDKDVKFMTNNNMTKNNATYKSIHHSERLTRSLGMDA